MHSFKIVFKFFFLLSFNCHEGICWMLKSNEKITFFISASETIPTPASLVFWFWFDYLNAVETENKVNKAKTVLLIMENNLTFCLGTFFLLLILDKNLFVTVWKLWQKIVVVAPALMNVLLVSQKGHTRRKRVYIRQYQKMAGKQGVFPS